MATQPEGAEGFALELGRGVEAGLGDDHAALDTTTADDLDRSFLVIKADKAGVREDADIDHAGTKECDHLGESRSVHEFERQPVFFAQLFGMRDKKGAVAETAAMGGLECRGGVGPSIKETHRHGHGDDPRSRATAQKITPFDRNLANAAMITHSTLPAERS